MPEFNRKTKIFLLLPLVLGSAFLFFKYTKAQFFDSEKVLGNTIQVGIWGEGSPEPTPTSSEIIPTPTETLTPTPTGEIPLPTATSTPTSTPTPASLVAGSVVINELMWMGSVGNSDDEWIELRNTTGQEINLSGWQLTRLISSETLMLTIPSGKTIPANSYFLISRLDKVSSAISVEPDLVDSSVLLRNNDLQIKLYKGNWTDSFNLIDTADDGSGAPLAGNHSPPLEQSMERNDDPSTGWQTCTNGACNDTTYWDEEGDNYGTPKAPNL